MGMHAESSGYSAKIADIFSSRLQIHTIMANSHFPASAWKEMIKDTLHGNAIDYSAKRPVIYHQAAFDMCNKILLALQELPETVDVCLGGVSEFDETFIFDGHIADGTLALCDGLRSYHAFPGIADCTIKDCNNGKTE